MASPIRRQCVVSLGACQRRLRDPSGTGWTTITIRPATAIDVDRMAEIVNAEPGDEPIALMGDVELARRYGIGLFKLDPIPNDQRVTVVAQEGDTIVGVLQYEFGDLGKPHSHVFDKTVGDAAVRLAEVAELVLQHTNDRVTFWPRRSRAGPRGRVELGTARCRTGGRGPRRPAARSVRRRARRSPPISAIRSTSSAVAGRIVIASIPFLTDPKNQHRQAPSDTTHCRRIGDAITFDRSRGSRVHGDRRLDEHDPARPGRGNRSYEGGVHPPHTGGRSLEGGDSTRSTTRARR